MNGVGQRVALLTMATVLIATCSSDSIVPQTTGFIAIGTWGGDLSGMIVTDSSAHVHIGCTYGDVIGLVPLDDSGKFDIAGSYLLRAYPVAVGPTMPAQFTGTVNGARLTLIVAVNDTVEHAIRVLGPVTLQFGKEPQMGPCPICRQPGLAAKSSPRSDTP